MTTSNTTKWKGSSWLGRETE